MLFHNHRAKPKVHLSESRPLPRSVPASESIPKVCLKRNKREVLQLGSAHYCESRSSTLCEDKGRTHKPNKSDITSVQNKNTAGGLWGCKRPLQALSEDPRSVKQRRQEHSGPDSVSSLCMFKPYSHGISCT